jgi:hypothetical protein
VGTENWPYTHRGAGALKFDRAVHSIRVGAGQGTEATPGRCFGQHLWAGDTESEGEVGMNVEVSKQGESPLTADRLRSLKNHP